MSGNNVQNNFKCTHTGEQRKDMDPDTRPRGKSFLLGLISTIFSGFYDPKIQVFGVWPWPGPSFPLPASHFAQPWVSQLPSSPSRLHFVVACSSNSNSNSYSSSSSQFSFNCCLGFPLRCGCHSFFLPSANCFSPVLAWPQFVLFTACPRAQSGHLIVCFLSAPRAGHGK